MLVLSPETEALIRAKATQAGKTPDQVICDALADAGNRGSRAGAGPRKKASLADIIAIMERSAARPLLDPRNADEIIDYDERGLPK
jgi:hypothetical protein